MLSGFDIFYGKGAQPVTELSQTISPPGYVQGFIFKRKISEEELNEFQIDAMPGFSIDWSYNMNLEADYEPSFLSSEFERYLQIK